MSDWRNLRDAGEPGIWERRLGVDIPCNPDGLAMDCCATCQFVKLRRFDRRQCYCDQTDMDVAETSVCNEYERHAELEWD